MEMHNFTINGENGIVSEKCIEFNIRDFHTASQFVAKIPYKRNRDKNNILCIFEEKCGTCSTKHAVLKKLALENNENAVKLMLGLFKMDSRYAPAIKNTLQKYGLPYIPEAHNYLKIGDQYYDFTKSGSSYNNFKNNILSESEIEYDQIVSEKISIHKRFLQKWLDDEKISYKLEEIWRIREECIKDLQKSEEDQPDSNFSSVCFLNSPEVREEYKQ
ncbi:hypothetical protein [Chryseobacterium indologenes]|uniref:hypothetical protein n=1 Tax=Chryseobacterium indologenes TaxID=253 RepID=UPI000AAF631E|nr:hypothetical protein [Chryseobacterium indologenes]